MLNSDHFADKAIKWATMDEDSDFGIVLAILAVAAAIKEAAHE